MKIANLCRVLAGIVAISFASAAIAADQWVSGTVTSVYPMGNGDFVLVLSSNPTTCTNPNNPKYLWVTVGQNGVTADGAKAMLATALTASVTGKTLDLVFSDSTTSCYVNRFAMRD